MVVKMVAKMVVEKAAMLADLMAWTMVAWLVVEMAVLLAELMVERLAD